MEISNNIDIEKKNNNLEECLRQEKPITNPYVKTTVGILYISSCMLNEQQHFFKQYGITSQQYNLLRILRGVHPHGTNLNSLREKMIDKMSDASRLVDRLVATQLVSKMPNNIDRRILDIKITPQALEILSQIDQHVKGIAPIANYINEEEAAVFNKMIDQMLEKQINTFES